MSKITTALQSVAASLMLLLGAGNTQAQKVNENVDIMYYFGCHDGNYLTVDGGMMHQQMTGGLSDQTYNRWGGNFRMGLQHYFTKHLGLGVGLQYSIARFDSIQAGDYVQKIAGAIDEANRPYEHHTVFHGFSESTNIHALSVPAMIYYQANMGISWKLYLAGGAMMTFYPKTSYKTTGSLETRAYYDDWQLDLGDVEGHNIYTTSESHEGKYTFNPNLSAVGEAGILYAINPRLDAYLAVQGCYRLTPLPESSDKPLYDPDCMSSDGYQDVAYNGMLNSSSSPKINELALGLQLGIRLRLSKEAKLQFRDYQNRRRAREVEEFEFKRVGRKEFNDVENRRQEIADSIARINEARLEAERQQRIKDSLDAIAAIDTTTLQPADSLTIEVATDTLGSGPTAAENEVKMLIASINQNYCAINQQDMANQQSLSESISRLSEIMAKYPDIRILIKGHTCNLGSMELNRELGMRRAEALRNQMIDKGVRPEQIRCESLWWKEPLVPNTSEPNRAKNRRVEIIREK